MEENKAASGKGCSEVGWGNCLWAGWSGKISLLLLLSRFSHVRFCATTETAAHQAPLSLGFSRQEHWNGLPFPSPVHEKWKVKVKSLSCVRLLATPWTVAHQAPPSMGFSRQEHWSGAPLPSPRSPWGGDIWAVVWVKRPAMWDMGKSVLREGTSSGKAQRMSLGCLRNSRKARVAGTERTGKEQKWYG